MEPLIKRARGAQCEQCLSRKQLQIEYEVDVDAMADMYDKTYPGDDEGKFISIFLYVHVYLFLYMLFVYVYIYVFAYACVDTDMLTYTPIHIHK
ncbi:hypothetical protein EON65_02105 [archaeon]|nr:MAG: hypothetical protein EON65_02105 [archaeon]